MSKNAQIILQSKIKLLSEIFGLFQIINLKIFLALWKFFATLEKRKSQNFWKNQIKKSNFLRIKYTEILLCKPIEQIQNETTKI